MYTLVILYNNTRVRPSDFCPHNAAQRNRPACDISPQNWIATIYGTVLCGSREISTGPVHGEGFREKKSKRDASSVRGVRVSTGSFLRFVWL